VRPSRKQVAIFALALGGFGIGLTEFVTFGLLPQIARDLLPGTFHSDRGEALSQAGWTVSAYALGVVVGAPTLVVLSARMHKVKLLAFLLVGLAVGNLLSALAPSLGLLLVARFLAGIPHGAYFGVAGLLAAEMIGPGARSRGLAIVLSGLTIANVVGVPAITRLGQLTSWRLAYVTVAVVFIVAMTIAVLTLHDPGEAVESSPRAEFGALRAPAVWLSFAVAAVGFAGFFAVDSYLVPVTTHSAHLSASVAPWVLATVGIGMTVGNAAGGICADRRPIASLLGGLLALTAAMCAFALLAHTTVGLFLTAFAVGATALFMGSPLQALLIRAAPGAVLIGPALNQSAANTANAIGALAGGAVLSANLPYTATGWVGAGLALGGLALALVAARTMTSFGRGPQRQPALE
jgi:MFS transporter, DHA1 family, inner membrane transport protein